MAQNSDTEKKQMMRFLAVGRITEPGALAYSSKNNRKYTRIKIAVKKEPFAAGQKRPEAFFWLVAFDDIAEEAIKAKANDIVQVTGDCWKRYSKQYGEEYSFIVKSFEIIEQGHQYEALATAAAHHKADFDDIEF